MANKPSAGDPVAQATGAIITGLMFLQNLSLEDVAIRAGERAEDIQAMAFGLKRANPEIASALQLPVHLLAKQVSRAKKKAHGPGEGPVGSV